MQNIGSGKGGGAVGGGGQEGNQGDLLAKKSVEVATRNRLVV